MNRVQTMSGDAWSVLGSMDGTSFSPILTSQTDEGATPERRIVFLPGPRRGSTGYCNPHGVGEKVFHFD